MAFDTWSLRAREPHQFSTLQMLTKMSRSLFFAEANLYGQIKGFLRLRMGYSRNKKKIDSTVARLRQAWARFEIRLLHLILNLALPAASYIRRICMCVCIYRLIYIYVDVFVCNFNDVSQCRADAWNGNRRTRIV